MFEECWSTSWGNRPESGKLGEKHGHDHATELDLWGQHCCHCWARIAQHSWQPWTEPPARLQTGCCCPTAPAHPSQDRILSLFLYTSSLFRVGDTTSDLLSVGPMSHPRGKEAGRQDAGIFSVSHGRQTLTHIKTQK